MDEPIRNAFADPAPPAEPTTAIGDRVEVTTADGFVRIGRVVALDAVAVDLGGVVVAVQPGAVRRLP